MYKTMGLNAFNMHKMFSALDEVYPGMINNKGLSMNCYFCTVAHLARTDVETLAGQTELMQNESGGTIAEIKELFEAAGLALLHKSVAAR
ncbi:hypothetical protein [Burkholderia ubonensis]|uniref:hypothetical protein n=1 Tax=Burkholderia ubonensis TaxID=101571 RepID=UPI0012F92C6D|nr:hypothetical protein [Burkholderia ubonensis]